jgi:XTP/dITP diphosphohydrolase
MKKNNLTFVTTNNAKYEQVKTIFESSGIVLTQASIELIEPNFDELSEIAHYKCKQAYQKIKKPVIVDDSGFFFKATPNFPGVRSAWVYKVLGYQGMMDLLKDKNREAYAQSVACYTENGNDFYSFTGSLHGVISTVSKEYKPLNERMPYKDIFYPDGLKQNLNSLDSEYMKKNGHRESAFTQLVDFINVK